MPARKRYRSKYPGVYHIMGTSHDGRAEKIFYVRYYKTGVEHDEKAGRQFKDNMTAAKANTLRSLKVEGKRLTNAEKREAVRAEKMTVGKLWVLYREQHAGASSLKDDERRYESHLKKPFGDKIPEEIAPLDVDRVRIRLLKKKGLKPQTVRHVLALLKRLVRFGLKRGLCQPLSFQMSMPRVDNQITEDLTEEQLERLLAALKASPHQAVASMMKLALFTGMRRGEIFKLKWSDLDFERGFILIRDPKGGQSASIPMNEQARDVLAGIEETEGSAYVFPGRGGDQRKDIKRGVAAIRKAAKLPEGFRPIHGLRHVYASTLASSGKVDLYTLQRLLTHKSPQMTARYAHLRDETLRAASDLAGQLMVSKPKKKRSG